MSTLDTIVPGAPGPGGYRQLERARGEAHIVRTDLGGSAPSKTLRTLCSFVHLSDLHVTDEQSPARVEFLDRFGDFDSPYAQVLGRVGTYRAHEALTYQVVEAMACSIRQLGRAPYTGAPLDFAISTGDATDNCQSNELESYIALLDGDQVVLPDSGDLGRYEGVGSPENYDIRYWHPGGTPSGELEDLPRARHGFPIVPGLLDEARRPFRASGLGLPWFAVYGNHDALLAGTVPADRDLRLFALGNQKPKSLHGDVDVLELLANIEVSPGERPWGTLAGSLIPATPDPGRRLLTRREWIEGHLVSTGLPHGHGFDAAAGISERAYYAFDFDELRFLTLDTVNPAGGWQGSIDGPQLEWLEDELIAGHSYFLDRSGRRRYHDVIDRYFVLASHHNLATLINPYAPNGMRRVLGRELEELLARFSNVVLWVNGHTHVNAITTVAAKSSRGLWQVTTASHIDWPQQARAVEICLAEDNGDIVVATTMLDHSGVLNGRCEALEEPLTLAGWSRELSANSWQLPRHTGRCEVIGRGQPNDRNTVLIVPSKSKG